MIYRYLDIFFIVFHTVLIVFNLTGWIWKRTRFLNLVILLITGFSWLIIGLIVGTLGYCPLTDWHFRILYRLGESGLPNSYIKYLIDRLSGIDISSALIDQVTLYAFIGVIIISLLLNIRDYRLNHKHSDQ